MGMGIDRNVYALALTRMHDHRDAFPAADFDALVGLLAKDIQHALDDFTNPDFNDLTMKHLRRSEQLKAEWAR